MTSQPFSIKLGRNRLIISSTKLIIYLPTDLISPHYYLFPDFLR